MATALSTTFVEDYLETGAVRLESLAERAARVAELAGGAAQIAEQAAEAATNVRRRGRTFLRIGIVVIVVAVGVVVVVKVIKSRQPPAGDDSIETTPTID